MPIVHIEAEKTGGDVSSMRRDLASLLSQLDGGLPIKRYFFRADLEAVTPESVSQIETPFEAAAAAALDADALANPGFGPAPDSQWLHE